MSIDMKELRDKMLIELNVVFEELDNIAESLWNLVHDERFDGFFEQHPDVKSMIDVTEFQISDFARDILSAISSLRNKTYEISEGGDS